MNPYDTYDGSKYQRRFHDAIKLYRNSDYEGALAIICEITAAVEQKDVHFNKYHSYQALMRVCMGEKSAVETCRDIAATAIGDVEVHYNLALAEYKLGNRRRAVVAVQRGMSVDAGYPELRRLRAVMGTRREPTLGFLGRDNVVNKWLGKLSYNRHDKTNRY